jgi:hypothetical protein
MISLSNSFFRVSVFMMTKKRLSRFSIVATACYLVGSIPGCGESREDLFLKHAKRNRGQSAAADVSTEAAPPAAPPEPAKVPPPTPVARSVRSPQISDAMLPTKDTAIPEPGGERDLSELVGIKPIDQRKADAPKDEAGRRRKAFENLNRLNDALLEYLARNGRYPTSYLAATGGVPMLSWRVELLPYLGYTELYKQFDLNRGWNMTPNKQLLKYIPDEFVSPERLDTKTNMLFPSSAVFLFGENRGMRPSMVEDGPENTIMLIEANNELAVPWTEPRDFDPPEIFKMGQYLHQVRGDGTFAIWANGYPVLLHKNLTDMQLFQCFSFDKADGPQAGRIHRPITVQEVDEDVESDQSLPESLVAAAAPSEAAQESPSGMPPEEPEMDVAREPVPTAVEITSAQRKLREIFRDPLAEAKSSSAKSQLASKLVTFASTMENDPPGAYVLQSAAMKLAIDAADGSAMLLALDQRIARFEVDAYEENITWIRKFSEATNTRSVSNVEHGAMLARLVSVINAGIRRNDFVQAGVMARLARDISGMSRTSTVSRNLYRLDNLLKLSKQEHQKAMEHLEAFRLDPGAKDRGAAYGRFLCFIKGDWDMGLPLISAADSGDLAEVARMDQRGGRDSGEQLAIADAWWELGLRANGVYRRGAQERAVLWYSQAIDGIPDSLDRHYVENRLKEAEQSPSGSPLSVCREIADEVGVELGPSLTTLAVEGNRGVSIAGFAADDDDD